MKAKNIGVWAVLFMGFCASAACSTTDPGVSDADTPAPDGATPVDAHGDPTDSAFDAHADSPADAHADSPPDSAFDAPFDAPSDGSVDAPSDGPSDSASDASTDAGGRPELLTPAENNAAYEMRAVCTISRMNRAGTAESCCRVASYTTETVCDTALHELNTAGVLTLQIDPMSACIQTSTAGTCTRTGTLARCDSSGLTCPVSGSTAGAPALVVGTYQRRMIGLGAGATPKDQYWLGCTNAAMITRTAVSCAPPAAPANTTRTTTLVRTAPNTFSLRRSWAANAPAGYCTTPSFPPASDSLGFSTFVDGAAPVGGTFAATTHDCTYTLTKK